jgi:hypothetical protein
MSRKQPTPSSSKGAAIRLAIFGSLFVGADVVWAVAAVRWLLAGNWLNAAMCGIAFVAFGAVVGIIFLLVAEAFRQARRERDGA